jgi:hypothetical protein
MSAKQEKKAISRYNKECLKLRENEQYQQLRRDFYIDYPSKSWHLRWQISHILAVGAYADFDESDLWD